MSRSKIAERCIFIGLALLAPCFAVYVGTGVRIEIIDGGMLATFISTSVTSILLIANVILDTRGD